MYSLRLLKLFHEIGIYKEAVGGIKEITDDDYYELALNGIACVSSYYEAEQLGEDVCCGGHVVHHFSDPAMVEYYRLCRLYEIKHSVTKATNPYVTKADRYYISCLEYARGNFGTDYNNEDDPKEIWIETCPESCLCEYEVVEFIHDMMEYYRNEVETLRTDLLTSPIVWLPALPPHVKAPRIGVKAAGRARKRRKKSGARKGKALKNATQRKG
jgi:hypothetical protein